MFFYNKTLKVQVAKHVKVLSDSILQKGVQFSYPEQYFFLQQVAYVFHVKQPRPDIQSENNAPLTVLLQKKENILSYLKFHHSALNALLTLGSLPQKYYKTHYSISHLNNLPYVSPDYSITFLGADNELYTAYHLNNRFEIIRISDATKIYGLTAFKTIGIGLPLYNNYIPYIVGKNNVFYVSVYDIINKTKYEIAKYSVDFLEKKLSDYIKELTGHDVSKSITQYREFYYVLEPYRFTNNKARRSFNICNNLSICKTVLYIGNKAINERDEHIIFEMSFKIKGHKLHYEFSIPYGLSLRWRGLNKTMTKHIIETQKLSIELPKANYIALNIVHNKNHYLIVRDFVYKNSYYMLDLKKHTKNRIYDSYGYGVRFYIANNIIMIVYFTTTKLSHDRGAWHLMIYNTMKRRFFITLIDEWYEGANADIVSYYYIEQCQKAVFMLGSVNNNRRDFYDIEQIINRHTVSAITILDLKSISNITDNEEIEKCKEMIKFPRWLERYLENKKRSGIISHVQADCTVDTNNARLYITAFVPDYKNPVITIAKNLCGNKTEFYDFDLGVPILRTRKLIEDRIKPIYVSRKALTNAGFPKYLHMYDLRGFYNFVNSKTIITGLIFISYPYFLIIDKHYHRLTQFYKRFSDFYLTYPILIDNYLVGYYTIEHYKTRSTSLAGVFVINELTIVKVP